MAELVGDYSLEGRVVGVPGLGDAERDDWFRILAEFARYGRDTEVVDRCLFVLDVVTTPTCPRMIDDVDTVSIEWRARVARLDMALFVSWSMRNNGLSRINRNTAVAVATELAGSDPELAIRLCDDVRGLLDRPTEVLEGFARERGWTAGCEAEANWESGTLDFIDGDRFVHSAFCIARGFGSEVQKRIWSGQVGVIFKFIEEERQRVIRDFGRLLDLPCQTSNGSTDDPYDLEIGHLLFQLRRRVGSRERTRLTDLVDMRNRLAHLEVVPGDLLARF